MTKVGKVVKSVAGTALRAAAAAATAVVMDKMTDALAEKVQEMAKAQPAPLLPEPPKAGGAAKADVKAKSKTKTAKKKVAARKAAKKKKA